MKKIADDSDLKQPHQFRSRDEQFASQRTTSAKFSTLNKPIDTEIIDAKKIGSLLNGIGESLLFSNERLWRWNERFHTVNADHTRPPSALRSLAGAVFASNYFASSIRMLVITPFSPASNSA